MEIAMDAWMGRRGRCVGGPFNNQEKRPQEMAKGDTGGCTTGKHTQQME